MKYCIGNVVMNLNKEDIGKFIGEMKKFISDNEMKIFKSHNEHKRYYLRVFDKIGEKEEYIKISRLRKSPTRYFFEEFATIMTYVDAKYKDSENILWRWCGDEQPEPNLMYDGIIMQDKTVVEKIEIVCPFHSQEDIIAGMSLNETGTYCCDPVYVDDYEEFCKNKVLEEVIKKNSKKTYDNSITLVVMFDEYKFLPSSKLMDKNFIDSLFSKLKNIDYIFKNVYILMDKYDGSSLKYEPYLIQIK